MQSHLQRLTLADVATAVSVRGCGGNSAGRAMAGAADFLKTHALGESFLLRQRYRLSQQVGIDVDIDDVIGAGGAPALRAFLLAS